MGKTFTARLCLILIFGYGLVHALYAIVLRPPFESYYYSPVLNLFVSESYRFNSRRWKDSLKDSKGYEVRWRMYSNLLWRYNLVGMDRSEVDALLGVPVNSNYNPSRDYKYLLGPDDSGVDSQWLQIIFCHDAVHAVERITDTSMVNPQDSDLT